MVPVPPTLVTPALLEVPAPISVLTSAALIPAFNDGVVPFDSIAGVPVSETLALFVVILEACVVVIPTLAVLAVIALACAEVIVVMLPAFAVVAVVPIAKVVYPESLVH